MIALRDFFTSPIRMLLLVTSLIANGCSPHYALARYSQQVYMWHYVEQFTMYLCGDYFFFIELPSTVNCRIFVAHNVPITSAMEVM